MTEEELTAALSPVLDELRNQASAEKSALDAAERKIAAHEALLARVSAMATKAPEGIEGLEAAAFGVIEDHLRPAEAKLEAASTTIASLDFVVQSQGAADSESAGLLNDLVSGAEDYLDQIVTVFDPVDTAFEVSVDDVQTKTSELRDLVTETIDDAITAADALQNRLGQGIPEATAPVAQLIDSEFGAELQRMAEQADALIANVERLVSGASDALETGLGGVTDLLQEVNKLVQPLDPAFDAMEILRG
ncbi:MAG: hypothetical protein AAF950_16925 [Pseudomonadota bacterium]